MITKEQAMAAGYGKTLFHVSKKDSRGEPMRIRVSGKCQTWKTRPEDFKLPVKYGMYESGYITPSNAAEWGLTPAEPLHGVGHMQGRGAA